MLAIYLCIMRLEYIASIYYNETVNRSNQPRPTGQPTGRKEIEMENKNYEAIARELAKMLIKKQMPDTTDDMMEMHIDSLLLTVDILLNETH